MEKSRFKIPQTITEDDIYNMFIDKIAGQEEIWIHGEPLLITINYRITDPHKRSKEVIIPEKEGQYTQSPVLEINDVDKFKKALYAYVKAYTDKESYWTRPDLADNWKDAAMYSMAVIWTNATNQDFTNPVDFLSKYKAFLEQDQWEELRINEKIGKFNGLKLYQGIKGCMDEREAPNNYFLYAESADGKKYYFPSVVYGIKENKAYVLAIHQIYNKGKEHNEDIEKLRNRIKGRGVEPLGIATLISFIEEAKKRGIEQIIMPDNFVMQYTTKNKIKHLYSINSEDDEEKLNNDHMGSMNRRLTTMMHVIKYYSTGIKVVEIPGDVSDNLTVNIQNFKIGREEKQSTEKSKQNETAEREL